MCTILYMDVFTCQPEQIIFPIFNLINDVLYMMYSLYIYIYQVKQVLDWYIVEKRLLIWEL